MKKCLRCGKPFRPSLHHEYQRFCSKDCADKEYQKTHRKQIQEQKKDYYNTYYKRPRPIHYKVKGLHLWEKDSPLS